jgi:hypothetical protein
MKTAIACALVIASVTSAAAGGGFFMGGAADGMADAQQLDLQRRALEIDARDGGNRYWQLRELQEREELNRLLRESNDLLRQYQLRQLAR